MHSLLQATLLAAFFTSTALAQGFAEIINGCPFEVYYLLADSKTTFNTSEVMTLPANDGFYTEPFDPNNGRAIQVATDPIFLAGDFPTENDPLVTMEYSVGSGDIFYDLSRVGVRGEVNPDAFPGRHVILETTDPSCPTSTIGGDSQGPDGRGTVRTCQDNVNLLFLLCTD